MWFIVDNIGTCKQYVSIGIWPNLWSLGLNLIDMYLGLQFNAFKLSSLPIILYSKLILHTGHGIGTMLAGGAAAAAAAYGASHLAHGAGAGHYAHGAGHYGFPGHHGHGKFKHGKHGKHGMFGHGKFKHGKHGKHGMFGGKFKKWK